MKSVSFLCLCSFWLGIFLCMKKTPMDLKDRIRAYLGLSKGKKGKFAQWLAGAQAAVTRKVRERELSESLAYIKNMVVLGRGGSISTQQLLEELAEVTDSLSDTYLKMSQFINLNETERAASCLSEAIDAPYALDLGRFLADWENLPAEELLPGIQAYQSSLREMRDTQQRRRDETISDLIYFPVVLNCMAVLLNFIYVGFFLPQKEMLSILF